MCFCFKIMAQCTHTSTHTSIHIHTHPHTHPHAHPHTHLHTCTPVHTCTPHTYFKVTQLNTLIGLLLGNLTSGDRQKIMTICTIDVHARDVVGKLIQQKAENAQAFTWLSQLRHRWDESQKHCFANICDAQFKYAYEYLGNTPRLVITPLTDR